MEDADQQATGLGGIVELGPNGTAILDAFPDNIALLDGRGVVISVNASWRRFAQTNGGSPEAVDPVGSSYEAICASARWHPAGADAWTAWAGIESVLSRKSDYFTLEYVCDSPAARRWFKLSVFPLMSGLDGAVVAHADISHHKAVEAHLASERNQLQTLLEAIPDLVWMKSGRGAYLRCNPAFEKFIGAREADIVGKGDFDFLSAAVADGFRQRDMKAVSAGRPIVSEEWFNFAGDGHSALFETTRTPIRDADGQVVGVVGIGHDITERHRMTDQIQALALHDVLTKLPNRRLLYDHLGKVRAACRRWGHFATLMLVDLDGFKQINDQYGHMVGDSLLTEAAARLRHCVRDTDTVARYGGDEFIVLVDDLTAKPAAAEVEAALVAEKIRAALAENYVLARARQGTKGDGMVEFSCTASIGVVMVTGWEETGDDSIRCADAAMYEAKAAGRNCVRFPAGG
jgi:diguanylate cyclase (GGDEF)-like protein/PAS domain S-box-containing protein